MTRPRVPRTVPGADAVARRIILGDALGKDVDPRIRAVLEKQLAGLLPGNVVAPGAAGGERTVRPDDLSRLVPSAAIAAAGLDPALTALSGPTVLWTQDGSRLLVRPAAIRTELGEGVVELTIPVSCDQTGDAEVTVTFLTGSPDRPTGGVTVTEDHARGPAAVVETWSDALIALAWDTLQIAASALAGVGASDPGGRPLITNALAVSANGLGVVPMGRHPFLAADAPVDGTG